MDLYSENVNIAKLQAKIHKLESQENSSETVKYLN